jgi:4-amino-4-deoxy-L-arabinose transferase-like glycosyltransferase
MARPNRQLPKSQPTRTSEPVSAADASASLWASLAQHGLLLTIVLTLLVRVLHLLSVRASDPQYALALIGTDMHTYVSWGKSIAAGDWLSIGFTKGEPFYYGPLYAYFLAVWMRICGENYDLLHGVQALVAVVPPIAAWSVARRLFGPGPAVITGVLAAFCVPLFYYEQVLLMEGLLAAIHAGILWALVCGQESRRRWLWALLAGLLSGAACWGRGSFLLVIPLLALAITIGWRRDRTAGEWKRGASACVLYFLGAALLLSVTLWRNVHVSGEYVLVSSNGPVLLYIGNASDSSGILDYSASFNRRDQERGKLQEERDSLRREANAAMAAGDSDRAETIGPQLAALDERLDRFWTDAVFDEIRAHPAAWPRLLLGKTWIFCNGYEVPDNVSYDLDKRHSWLMRWSPVTWGVLVSLAAAGVVRSWRTRRRQLVLYAYTIGFAVSIILVFVVGRYRLPMCLPMLAWSGLALWEFLADFRERRWISGGVAAVAVALCIAVTWPTRSPAAKLNDPVDHTPKLVRAQSYVTLATAYVQRERKPEAVQILDEVSQLYPADPDSAVDVSRLYAACGLPSRAMKVLVTPLKRGRASEGLILALAGSYAENGRSDLAIRLLQQFLQQVPASAAARDLLSRIEQQPPH